MNKIVERFNKLLNISFLMVAIDFIVGLLFVLKPEISNKVSLIAVGSLVLVHGLYALINYFYDGLGNKFFKIELIMGIIWDIQARVIFLKKKIIIIIQYIQGIRISKMILNKEIILK